MNSIRSLSFLFFFIPSVVVFSTDNPETPKFYTVLSQHEDIFISLELSVRGRLKLQRELRQSEISRQHYGRKEFGKIIAENRLLLEQLKNEVTTQLDLLEKKGLEALKQEELIFHNEKWSSYQQWVLKTKERIIRFISDEEVAIKNLESASIKFDKKFNCRALLLD